MKKLLIGFNSAFITLSIIALIPTYSIAQNYEDVLPAPICNTGSENRIDAIATVPTGDYDIFVRVFRNEEAVTTRLYETNQIVGTCSELGSATAATGEWRSIGSYRSNSDSQVFFTLAIDSPVTSFLSAGSPEIILMNRQSPPCDLVAGCKVDYELQSFELQPRLLSLSSDPLRVGLLTDYRNDTVRKVIYSVDGKQVYETEKLEIFNYDYVSDGRHSLQRTVLLESGQALRSEEIIDRGFNIEFYLRSYFFRYSRIIGIVLLSFIFILLTSLIVYGVRRYMRWRAWSRNHFYSTKSAQSVIPQQFSSEISYSEIINIIRKPLIGLMILTAFSIFFLNFVVSVFRVDGQSMEPTLLDNSQKPLIRFPVTLGAINGSGYLPNRGKVVVVRKVENNLFTQDIEQTENYVVKRVIALPNERVVVNNAEIKIYNSENPEGFIPDDIFNWIIDREPGSPLRIDLTLKENEVFVVGDNRDDSIDSRNYGPISTDQIVGFVIK